MSTPASPAFVSSSFTLTTIARRRPSRPCRRGARRPSRPSRPPRPLHAGADERRLGAQRRHGLALHVRPINARFASSCSRNGISDAATETICFGETSMYWICSAGSSVELVLGRLDTRSSGELALRRQGRVRLRDHVLAFLDRREVIDLGRNVAVLDLRYGVSRKPYSLVRA